MSRVEGHPREAGTYQTVKTLTFDLKTSAFTESADRVKTNPVQPASPTSPIQLPTIAGGKPLPKALQPKTANHGVSIGYKPIFTGYGSFSSNPSGKRVSEGQMVSSYASVTLKTPQCSYVRPSTAGGSLGRPGHRNSVPEVEGHNNNSNRRACLQSRGMAKKSPGEEVGGCDKASIFLCLGDAFERRTPFKEEKSSEEAVVRNVGRHSNLTAADGGPTKMADRSDSSEGSSVSRAFIKMKKPEMNRTPSNSGIDSRSLDLTWSASYRKHKIPNEGIILAEPSPSFPATISLILTPTGDENKNFITAITNSDDNTVVNNDNIITNSDNKNAIVIINNDKSPTKLDDTMTSQQTKPCPDEILMTIRHQVKILPDDDPLAQPKRRSSTQDEWDDYIPVSPRRVIKHQTHRGTSDFEDASAHEFQTATQAGDLEESSAQGEHPVDDQLGEMLSEGVVEELGKALGKGVEECEEKYDEEEEDAMERRDDNDDDDDGDDEGGYSNDDEAGDDSDDKAGEGCKGVEDVIDVGGDGNDAAPPLPLSIPPHLKSNETSQAESVLGVTDKKVKLPEEKIPDESETAQINGNAPTTISYDDYQTLLDKEKQFMKEFSRPERIGSDRLEEDPGSGDSGGDELRAADDTLVVGESPVDVEEQSNVCNFLKKENEEEEKEEEEEEEEEEKEEEKENEEEEEEEEKEDDSFPTREEAEDVPTSLLDSSLSGDSAPTDEKLEITEEIVEKDAHASLGSPSRIKGQDDLGSTKVKEVSDTPATGRDTTVVNLNKGFLGVGFCIEGGRGWPTGDQPICIKRVVRGDVPLTAGDELVSVNGEEVGHMTCSQVWNLLKTLPDGVMILEMRRRRSR